MLLFLEAFALGVAVAAPFGPVGATVVRVGLLYGLAAAIAIGLGAAVVDGVYFALAAAGAGAAFQTAWLGVPLWLGGSAFLAYLGLSGLLRRTAVAAADASTSYPLSLAFGRGLLITMTNPLTVASWLAIAGSLAVSADDVWLLAPAALFIAAGSVAWFTFLSLGVAWSRRLATDAVLRWSATAASLVILLFAVRFLVEGLRTYVL